MKIILSNKEMKNLKNKITELENENKSLKQELNSLKNSILSHKSDADIYFHFFDMLKDFFWILDEKGDIIFVNDYVIDRLHYTRDELYKKNVLFVHPQERREEAGKIVGEMLGGKAEFCPIPIITKEGIYIPVETRVVQGKWNNKNVIFGVSKDISELKLSEEKFSKAFHLNSNLIAISEFETGKYIDVNQKFLDLFQLTRDEVIGKTSVEINIFDEKTRNKITTEFNKTGKLNNLELIINYNGRKIYGLFSANLFYLQEKKCWITVMQNITDIKNAQEELKKSEERYKNFIKHSPDIIYKFSNKRGGLFWSDRVKDILGFSPNEIMNKPFLWNSLIHPEDKIAVQQAISDYSKGADYNIEYRIKTKSKNWIWVHDYFMHKTIIDDEIIIEGHTTDITARKEAAIQIKKLNEKLINLNADKDLFITILAHDLKNPFNAILGFLNLLTENIRKYDINKIEQQLNLINKSAQNTFSLLEDILMWVRANSGKIPFEPQILSFSTICNEIIESLQLTANAKDITINYFATEEISIYADKNMLTAVLRNLVSNSIKFTKKNGEINIYAVKNHSDITITVSDNGIGIDPDILNQLFDITHKIITYGTANEKGTGLGLLLCKEFVEKHGGNIWVESEVGKGSDFKFTMPIYKENHVESEMNKK